MALTWSFRSLLILKCHLLDKLSPTFVREMALKVAFHVDMQLMGVWWKRGGGLVGRKGKLAWENNWWNNWFYACMENACRISIWSTDVKLSTFFFETGCRRAFPFRQPHLFFRFIPANLYQCLLTFFVNAVSLFQKYRLFHREINGWEKVIGGHWVH